MKQPSKQTVPNTPAPKRSFDDAEFQTRTRKAQDLMSEQGIDALLVTTEPEVRYFTGFFTPFWQSPTRPWFVVIPATGNPIAVIPEIGADLMHKTWVENVRTWSAPNPKDDGISLLVDALASVKTLGVMMGHETQLRMPQQDWQTLQRRLPGLKPVDATALIQGQRMVKSPLEIEKLGHICRIGSEVFATVPEFAQEGMPLAEVFRQFKIRALQTGADDAAYLVGGAGPGGYSDVISPPSSRPLQTGDVLMLDTGCTWDGYFCDFDRNWAIGHATSDATKAYDVLWRATEAGIEAAKPGTTCREVTAAMSHVIREIDPAAGDIGRMGHGLGMQLTEQPSLAAFDDTPLQEDMVITLEPSLSYGDGQMMVHEENILITQTGAELLSKRAPDTLPII